MDKIFEVLSVNTNNFQRKHKSRPTQFTSVASGIQIRLENNIRSRRSLRSTQFDVGRNIAIKTPAKRTKVSEVELKIQNRKMQLEKWKQEKENQRKFAASQKKKPFLAGVYHAPVKYEAPPLPKTMPSISGRVTRSQLVKSSNIEIKPIAPKDAKFHPPKLANMPKFNLDARPKKPFKVVFDPVIPNKSTVKTRSQRNVTNKIELKKTAVEAPPKSSSARNPISHRRVVDDKSGNRKTTKKQSLASQSSVSVCSTKSLIVHKSSAQSESSKSTKTNLKSKQNKKPTLPIIITQSDSIDQAVEAVKKLHVSQNAVNSSTNMLLNNVNKTPERSNKFSPKSESSSEEKLRSTFNVKGESPQTPEGIVEETKELSPCVTMSRGKDNARKEMKQKLQEGLLDEDSVATDAVQHYRRQLASEIARITETCNTWDQIQEQTLLPEYVQELVLAATGQARLLMSQKLQQFASLVERCAAPDTSAALVTPTDLAGFWDMVFIQIENVDMRFKKLEELRSQNWVEERQQQQVKKIVKKNVKRSPKPDAGPSKLRGLIAAARKAKLQTLTPTAGTKTFEAGFFSVSSPVRTLTPAPAPTLTPATPLANHSLLKAVLSSEARKVSAQKNGTSFAMLRASLIAKNIDIEGISPLEQTPINLKATPARSILKSKNVKSDKKSSKKLVKAVLFFTEDDAEASTNLNEPKDDVKVEESSLPSELDEQKPDKENKQSHRKRREKLVRQDSFENDSPPVTRSRRKSLQEKATPKRSSTKKPLEDLTTNIELESISITPRRRKVNSGLIDFETPKLTPRRSCRLRVKDAEHVEEATPKTKNRKKGRKSHLNT